MGSPALLRLGRHGPDCKDAAQNWTRSFNGKKQKEARAASPEPLAKCLPSMRPPPGTLLPASPETSPPAKAFLRTPGSAGLRQPGEADAEQGRAPAAGTAARQGGFRCRCRARSFHPSPRSWGRKAFSCQDHGLESSPELRSLERERWRAMARRWAASPGLTGRRRRQREGGCSPVAVHWGRVPPRSNWGQSCYLTGTAPLCFLLLQSHPHFFLWTDHFPFGTEEGMALQVLIELVLGNVGKHFIVDLVCRAVGYPERQNEMSCPGHCVQGRSTNPSSDLPASAYPRASSSGAKQGRQREHRSVTRLQCNSSQSRGVDAAGLSVREAKSNSHSHGVNHVHHTQRQEGRENVSPCGKGQVREGKDSAVCQPGTTPDKRSAFRREARKIFLGE